VPFIHRPVAHVTGADGATSLRLRALREPLFSGTANPALAMIQFIATAVITTNVLSHGELTESAAARSLFSLLRCWEFPANSLPSPTALA
jgi:hypothetical protein